METHKKSRARNFSGSLLLIPLVVLSLTGCGKLDPRNVDVDLPNDMPVVKETSFDKSHLPSFLLSVIITQNNAANKSKYLYI